MQNDWLSSLSRRIKKSTFSTLLFFGSESQDQLAWLPGIWIAVLKQPVCIYLHTAVSYKLRCQEQESLTATKWTASVGLIDQGLLDSIKLWSTTEGTRFRAIAIAIVNNECLWHVRVACAVEMLPQRKQTRCEKGKLNISTNSVPQHNTNSILGEQTRQVWLSISLSFRLHQLIVICSLLCPSWPWVLIQVSISRKFLMSKEHAMDVLCSGADSGAYLIHRHEKTG